MNTSKKKWDNLDYPVKFAIIHELIVFLTSVVPAGGK